MTYFDILAFQSELKDWEMKVATNQTEAITMINVQTNIVKSNSFLTHYIDIPVPIKTIMHKFSLVNNETYDFGMVEVDTERRGNIEIHNPSEKPIEVSFHIAPSNYLEMIFQELMSDESLIKWMVLCEKFTFFDPHGRKMCQEFLSINVLSDERLSQVTYFFFKNYFNFINNNEIGEELFINFISEQKEILKGSIKNITDSTQATKPEAKEKCPGGCDNQNMLVSFFNKVCESVNL